MSKSNIKPFIIPIFLPNCGCKHQCIFCNQTSITGIKKNIPDIYEFNELVEKYLLYKNKKYQETQIAFYGGNFLGLEKQDIILLLDEAKKFVEDGKVTSIRFSTRPDTISDFTLDLIKDYPVKTIEIGVQSMDNKVLKLSKRGHVSLDTTNAVTLLKKTNYEIGLQLMLGLPGDNGDESIKTAKKIADFKPNFVRIYPTIVISGSFLAALYKKGDYVPMSLEKSVSLAKDIYILFKKNKISVIRMGLQASEELDKTSSFIAGPYHPAFGHLVYSEIFLEKAISFIVQYKMDKYDGVNIYVNPSNVSKMRGLNNSNIKLLKKKFFFKFVKILPDQELSKSKDCLEKDSLIIK